jgi:hypothetical protein
MIYHFKYSKGLMQPMMAPVEAAYTGFASTPPIFASRAIGRPMTIATLKFLMVDGD